MITASKNFTINFANIRETELKVSSIAWEKDGFSINCTNIFIDVLHNAQFIYFPTSGSITIDGENYSKLKIVSWCKNEKGNLAIDSNTPTTIYRNLGNGYYELTYNFNISNSSITINSNGEEYVRSIELLSDTNKVVLNINVNSILSVSDANRWQSEKVWVPFTTNQGISGTYNEKLTEKENGSYSLTFNIELFNNGHRNPLLEYLVEDRIIRLIQDNIALDFCITGITPSFSSNNISYAFTAQDLFSWNLSKQSIAISLSTEDPVIWDVTGPKTIYELSTKILELSNLDSLWIIDPKLATDKYEFASNLYSYEGALKCSFDISGQTPYNALIELGKIFNAIIFIDYNTFPYTITFKNKEKERNKGIKLNPDVNLSQFSYSDKADNLYSVMHISGGEDADGNYVSILPTIPSIVSELIIMLSRSSVQNVDPRTLAEKSFNYPKYYIYQDDDKYYLFWKNSMQYYDDTNKLECIRDENNGLKLTIKNTNELLFWEDEDSIDDVRGNLINKIYRIQDLLGISFTSSVSQTDTYFKDLRSIPHASSAFYDFTYYKDKNLLSENRYNKLQKLINVDLRNINLLLNSYTPIYYRLKYNLDKLVDKEKEYAALMSAEDKLIANYKFSDENNGYLSLRGLYSSNSIVLGSGDTQMHIMQIGYSKSGVTYYGMHDDSNYITHYLPDFSVIEQIILTDSTKEIVVTQDGKAITVNSFSKENETFTTPGATNIPIFLKYYETVDGAITCDITKELAESSHNDLVSIDKLGKRKIEDYMQNIDSLWDNTYTYYYCMLYGNEWFGQKRAEIKKQYDDYYLKRKNIETKLKQNFGDGWASLNINVLSTIRMVEYSDLTQQLDNLGQYVGGYGTRAGYSYLGLYDYYLHCIDAYLATKNIDTLTSKPITEIIDDLNNQKKQWLKNFYYLYSDVIREVNYNDSAQLTSSGLYAAAYKQFLQYKEPTKSYSASYITTEELLDVGETINIGDTILLKQDKLLEKIVPNAVQITVNANIGNIAMGVINYTNNAHEEGEPITTYKNMCIVYNTNDANRVVLFDNSTQPFNINNHTIMSIQLGEYLYTFNGRRKIECVEKVYQSKDVKLRITGLTKDLRSNVTQLTVEDNTIYNTLVDRLLYILR